MATRVLKNAYVEVNSVDVSSHVAQVSVNLTQDTPEDTAMGDDSHSYLAGLRGGSFDVTFNADDAAGAVSATLNTIHTGDAAVTFELRPDQGAVAVTNPKYTGSCILTSWDPFAGSVGDTAQSTASFQVTGDVTRATA